MLTPAGLRHKRPCDYDGFQHLKRALFWQSDALMYALTAYFDDSGKKENKLLVAGGYVATVRQWEQFTADWRIILARKGIEEFHRAEFNARKIGDWPDLERQHFLADLAQIIHRHTQYAFCYAVNMADWHAVNAEYQLEEKNFYPYPLCARTCIRGVREWCAARGRDKSEIEFIFDAGSEHGGHLIELLKRDVDPLLKGLVPTPADSKKVRPIQAADYFAWEIRHQVVKDRNPHPSAAYRSLARLLHVPMARADVGIWDRNALDRLVAKAKIPHR